MHSLILFGVSAMTKGKRIKPRERKTKLQKAFGAALKAKRVDAKLSQEKLADLAGLHFTYVSSVERGERNISLENIAKLSKGLKCSLAELLKDVH